MGANEDEDPTRGTVTYSSDGVADTVPAAPGETAIAGGTVVDRYVVGERLGAGGMGVVYRARDPELDRDVALKFLHPELGGERHRSRLRREARAMARLRHPNVIAVHDVGEHGDRTWLALELIEGATLRQRIAGGCTWAEARPWFLGAGRGLAAAHAVGIVHRDFKPENVLIDQSGVAHVADFGLAYSAGDRTISAPGAPPPAGPEPLTRTGSVTGTPRYMAPEQHDGGEVTAAADQFAFCVSLFEALYGRSPFPGKTLDELRRAVLAGELDPPPGTAPPHVRDAILRGLRREPGERHPSMDALLAALDRDPARRRRRIAAVVGRTVAVAGAAVAVTVGVGGAAGGAAGRAPVVCPLERSALNGAWDDQRRAEMAAAFGRSKHAYSRDALDRATRAIDHRTGEWLAARQAACRANKIDRTESDQRYARRLQCLDLWRTRLHALTDAFTHDVDGDVIARALTAVGALPAVSSCNDSDVLHELLLYGDDPRTMPLLHDLARSGQLFALGKFTRAVTEARALMVRAQAIGTADVVGRMQLFLGRALTNVSRLDEAVPLLKQTTENLAKAGNDEAGARTWVVLHGIAVTRKDWHEAASLAVAARAALARLAPSNPMRAEFLMDQGRALAYQRKLPEALALFQQTVAIRRVAYGPDDGDTTDALANVAAAHLAMRHFDNAEKLLGQTLATIERVEGPKHPDVIELLHNLGYLYARTGRLDQAIAVDRRALAVVADVFGKGPAYADSLGSVAEYEDRSGHPADALRDLTETVEILEHGGDKAALGNAMVTLGALKAELGRVDEGASLAVKGLALIPDDVPERVEATVELASLDGRARRWRAQCAAAAQAAAAARTLLRPNDPMWLDVDGQLARCKLETHAPAAAINLAARGLAIADGAHASGEERGTLELLHGRALWESGRDRAAGVAEVRTARNHLARAASVPARGTPRGGRRLAGASRARPLSGAARVVLPLTRLG